MVAGNFAMEFTEGCGGGQARKVNSSQIDPRLGASGAKVPGVACGLLPA